MRICSDHWAKLRAAIDKRGLTPLIAKSGEQAVAQMAKQLTEGEVTAASFDPLMAAHNMILSNALRVCGEMRFGLEVLFSKPGGGEHCPICYLRDKAVAANQRAEVVEQFEGWIERAADDVRAEAVRLGKVAAA